MASIIRGNDNFDSLSSVPSTDAGAVGTYTIAQDSTVNGFANAYSFGDTRSAANLRLFGFGLASLSSNLYDLRVLTGQTSDQLSGTWRYMSDITTGHNSQRSGGLWVRIS